MIGELRYWISQRHCEGRNYDSWEVCRFRDRSIRRHISKSKVGSEISRFGNLKSQ